MSTVVESAISLGANYDELISTVPIGRWGKPEEIAQVIVFLVSEKASLMTGEEVIVDGGHVHQV